MSGDLVISRRALRAVQSLPDAVKIVSAVVAILIFLAAFTSAVKAGMQVPVKLDAHMRQADTLIYELREGRRQAHEDALRQFCITVTPRADWPKECFAPVRAK